MKRTFSLARFPGLPLVVAGMGLIAATYGLVRLAYGLFLPDVQSELGIDAATAGLTAGGASVLYCIGAIAGFVFAASHPKTLVLCATATAAAGAAGMAAAGTPGLFAIAAIVGSAGAGLASPALVALVQAVVDDGHESRAQAIVNAGTGPGLVVAGVLALVLLPEWRVAWYAAAVLTLAVGVLVLVSGRAARMSGTSRASVPPASWFVAHARIIVVALLMGAGSAAIWTYGRSALVESGASGDASVLAWIGLGAGGGGVIATAAVVGRLRPSLAWALATAAAAGATAVAVIAPGGGALSILALALFGWGYTAGSGALIAWTAAVDAGRASTGTALLFVVLILGQAIGAPLLGVLIGVAGYPPAFLAAAVALAVAAALAVVPSWGRTGSAPVPTASAVTERRGG